MAVDAGTASARRRSLAVQFVRRHNRNRDRQERNTDRPLRNGGGPVEQEVVGNGENVKVHLVRTAPAVFRKRRLIHNCLFHGVGSRTGQGEFDDSPAAFQTNTVRTPLRIYRIGTWAPEIFSPRVNLIVSEKVRDALHGFESIDFLKVTFASLIDYQVPDGDVLAVRDAPTRVDPLDNRNILRTRANVPSLRQKVGNRYELLMPRVADIRNQYPDVRTQKIRIGTRAQGGEQVEFDL